MVGIRVADERGITLVELLIVMVLVGAVATAATTSILTMQRAQRHAVQVQTDLDTARVAMERVRKEIRAARGVTPASTETRLELRRTTGTELGASRIVTWELVEVGDRFHLQRYEGGPTSPRQTVARGLLPTSAFDYSNRDQKQMSRSIDVVLEVASGEGRSLTAETTVRLRNVGGPNDDD